MSGKLRITAKILPVPPDHGQKQTKLPDPIVFALPVNCTDNVGDVFRRIEVRFRENYASGRNDDWAFKKAQDGDGADLDVRDLISDVFEGVTHPRDRVIQVVQVVRESREDSIPVGSNLRPTLRPLDEHKLAELRRRRSQVDRYGAAAEELNPDYPVRSAEPVVPSSELGSPAPLEPEHRVEHRVDKDGFLIPSRVSKSQQEHQQRHSSSHGSEQGQEEEADREREQEQEHEPEDEQEHVSEEHEQAMPTQDPTPDPIEDEEEPKQRLSGAPKDNVQVIIGAPTTPSTAREGPYSIADTDMLIDALARGMPDHEIHATLFPNRKWDSVRKKMWRVKRNSKNVIQRKSRRLTVDTPTVPSAWSAEDDRIFAAAIKKNEHWRVLRNKHYLHRSEQSVMQKYTEVNQNLERDAKQAVLNDRHLKQLATGNVSTGPNEKFTADEDAMILAARIENAEMKRFAALQFPRRQPEQIKSRASKLYHDAEKAARKRRTSDVATSSSKAASVSTSKLLDALDAEVRARVEKHRVLVRQQKKQLDADRQQEQEEKERRQKKVSLRQSTARELRRREDRSNKLLDYLETAKAKDEHTQRVRSSQDHENMMAYSKSLDAWEKAKDAAEAAGKPVPEPPVMPRGSSYGVQVVVSKAPRSNGKAPASAPRASLPIPSSNSKPEHVLRNGTCPERVVVSSDNSSNFSDSDINDEDLSAAASQVYPSSPFRARTQSVGDDNAEATSSAGHVPEAIERSSPAADPAGTQLLDEMDATVASTLEKCSQTNGKATMSQGEEVKDSLNVAPAPAPEQRSQKSPNGAASQPTHAKHAMFVASTPDQYSQTNGKATVSPPKTAASGALAGYTPQELQKRKAELLDIYKPGATPKRSPSILNRFANAPLNVLRGLMGDLSGTQRARSTPSRALDSSLEHKKTQNSLPYYASDEDSAVSEAESDLPQAPTSTALSSVPKRPEGNGEDIEEINVWRSDDDNSVEAFDPDEAADIARAQGVYFQGDQPLRRPLNSASMNTTIGATQHTPDSQTLPALPLPQTQDSAPPPFPFPSSGKVKSPTPSATSRYEHAIASSSSPLQQKTPATATATATATANGSASKAERKRKRDSAASRLSPATSSIVSTTALAANGGVDAQAAAPKRLKTTKEKNKMKKGPILAKSKRERRRHSELAWSSESAAAAAAAAVGAAAMGAYAAAGAGMVEGEGQGQGEGEN